MVSLNSSAFSDVSDELEEDLEELDLVDEEGFEDGFFLEEPVLFVTALGNLHPLAYAFPNVPSA